MKQMDLNLQLMNRNSYILSVEKSIGRGIWDKNQLVKRRIETDKSYYFLSKVLLFLCSPLFHNFLYLTYCDRWIYSIGRIQKNKSKL